MGTPSIEVVAHGHRPRRPLTETHGEELAESRGAHDRGLVDLSVGADFVGGAVGGEGADLGAAVAGVVAVGFYYVVFCRDVLEEDQLDEGLGGRWLTGQGAVEPAVDGVVRALIGGVGAAEGDAPWIDVSREGSGMLRRPSRALGYRSSSPDPRQSRQGYSSWRRRCRS